MKYKSKSQRLTVFLLLAISIMILIDRVVFPDWFYLFKDVTPPGVSADFVNDDLDAGEADDADEADDSVAPSEEEHSFNSLNNKFLAYPIAGLVLDRQKFVSFQDWMRDLEDQEIALLARQDAADKKAKQDQQAALQKKEELAQKANDEGLAIASNDSRPKIVIIIDDLGIRKDLTKAISDLPGPITLSFLPYASNLQHMIDYGNDHGHEAMLHVPMEPMRSTIDPGPHALRVAMNDDEIAKNFRENLRAAHGYVGINNHMGSRFTQDRNAMQIVMQILAQEDLYFIDSKTIRGSVAYDMAQSHGIPSQERDVFLDHYDDPDFIDQQFALLQKIAKNKGHAIGIGHPYPHTLTALKKWLPIYEQAGIALVPASKIVGPGNKPGRAGDVYAQTESPSHVNNADSVGGFIPASVKNPIPNFDDQAVIQKANDNHVIFQTYFVQPAYYPGANHAGANHSGENNPD